MARSPIIFIVLLLQFTWAASEKLAQKKNTAIPFQAELHDSSSRCGGKLQAADGTISYKNFSPYQPNERCVWTARVANATSYNVILDSLGASETLLIAGFGLVGHTFQQLPNAAANISLPNTNVMVITFATSAANNTNNYRGFSLRYTSSIFEGNQKASATSEDVIVEANAGHIKYPSNRLVYGNFDLSIIVITPLFGVQKSLGEITELIYIRSGLEGQSCQDRLSIYEFQKTSSSVSWKLLGRMCGGVDSEVISGQDLIMVVFESDFSAVSSGFHLYTRYVQQNVI